MEIIDRLKEAYLDGARHSYLMIRGLLAYSRYMKSKNLDYKTTQHGHSSRLDARAEEIEEKYSDANIIIQSAYELGKKTIRKRPSYQTLEAKATGCWGSRFELFSRDLRLVK